MDRMLLFLKCSGEEGMTGGNRGNEATEVTTGVFLSEKRYTVKENIQSAVGIEKGFCNVQRHAVL